MLEKLLLAPSTDLGHMFGDAAVDVAVFSVDFSKEFAEEARVEFGLGFALEISLHFTHQVIFHVHADKFLHTAAAAALHHLKKDA